MELRPLHPSEIGQLSEIDPNYVSDSELVLECEGQGLQVTFRIYERVRAVPYVKRAGYSLDANYLRGLLQRINAGRGLYLGAYEANKVVGFLDLSLESWRPVASLEWIVVDSAWRGKGIGKALLQEAIAWARSNNLAAIALETQTTNIHACRFYERMGFRICGFQDPFYFNPLVEEEKAIYWIYEL
jgi:streptothricin acetyltransferase